MLLRFKLVVYFNTTLTLMRLINLSVDKMWLTDYHLLKLQASFLCLIETNMHFRVKEWCNWKIFADCECGHSALARSGRGTGRCCSAVYGRQGWQLLCLLLLPGKQAAPVPLGHVTQIFLRSNVTTEYLHKCLWRHVKFSANLH